MRASAVEPTGTTARSVEAEQAASGIVLATALGHRLGRRRQAQITLADVRPAHVRKPLLHGIAAGAPARLTYLRLDKQHQLAVHGFLWVALVSLINLLRLRTDPRLKLH